MIMSEGVSFSGSGSQESVRYKQGGALKDLCEMWGVLGGGLGREGRARLAAENQGMRCIP